MKVLFAVNDEKDAEAITRVYQKEYKEIISSKTVYYFNAIIKELQKDKTYDRIVISEDLEMFSSDNYQAVDKFIFEKMDAISDEATNVEGNDIPIILLCMDRRTKNDPLLVKLFGLGLYNVLIGQDRSIQKVAGLMYKPRTKKEAKAYYKVEAENVGYSADDKNGGVNETEIQNILNHYKKIGENVPKCVQSFESIMSQYSKEQVKLIAEVLPKNTKVILEENSDSYRKLMGIKGKKAVGTSQLRKTEYVEKELDSGNRLTQPVIIPTAVNTKQVNKVLSAEELKKKKLEEARKKEKEKLLKERAEAKRKAEAEARRKEEERIARERAEAEAKRKEEERIAKEKAEEEAKRREEERLAKEKAEVEARRKEEERIAREKAEAEARRKEEERIAREKAEAEARRKEEERIAREKAEAEAKRKEEEKIAKQKAAEEAKRKAEEEKAKKEAKERLEKERAEAKARGEAKKKAEEEKKIKEAKEIKRKEQEKMAEEKLKVENDEPVVKRGRGRPRKNPIVPVVLEDVPVKRKRGRPRKNPIEESVENVEKTIENVVEEKTEKISKPVVKENIKEVVDSKKNNEVEDDDLFDFIDFDDTVNQDSSNGKQEEKEIDEVDLDLYDDFDDFDDFDDESDNVDEKEELAVANEDIKDEENDDYENNDSDEEDSYYDDDDEEFDDEDEDFDYDSVYGQDNELSDNDEEIPEEDIEGNNEEDIEGNDEEDDDFLPGFDDEDLDDYDDYDFDDEIDDTTEQDNAEEENVEESSEDNINDEDNEFEDYDDENFDLDDYEEEDISEDENDTNNNEEDDDDFLPGFDEEDYNIEDDEIEDNDKNLDKDTDEDDEFLPGFDDETDDYEEDDDYDFVDDDENVEPESADDAESNEMEETDDDDDDDESLPGFEDENTEEEVETDNSIQYNGAFKGINNRNYKYDNDLANSIKDLKESENNTSSYNIDTDNLITSDQKVVSFVGTSKNGTSFIVNNLAEMYSNQGIQTAILDLTKNKNAYYVYTNNEDELREKAHDCFEKLSTGIADGIQVNKNLTVYTSLPGEDDSLDEVTNIIKTLLENYTIVLLDCDFETDARYFKIAQELYLVQSWDVLTIQPLTAFLRDLKVKNILETNKLRIIINKDVKIGSISEKALIGGMSSYSDPAMTYMTELFNRDTIKYITIPFDNQVYAKYLEGIANCKITTKGYSKSFMSSMNRLSDMVYPTISGKKSKKQYNDYTSQNKQFEDTFSKDTSSILDKMKKKY